MTITRKALIGSGVILALWAAFWTYKIVGLSSTIRSMEESMRGLAPDIARAPTTALKQRGLDLAGEWAWLIANAEHLRDEAIMNAMVGGLFLIVVAALTIWTARRVDQKRMPTA